MTVKELVEELGKLNQDYRVVTYGYEGGYQDIKIPKEALDIVLNVNSERYYGPHDDANSDNDGQKTEKAYVL